MIYALKKLAEQPLMAVFFNLAIAVFLGLWLRWGFVGNLPFDFTFLRHAHSHTALLGWVYLALFLFIGKWFHPNPRKLKTLFWLTQLSVLGMLFSFPFQGYAATSITFSTLHIILSYIFARKILKSGKLDTPAGWVLKVALWFMVISTLGVWTLGPIMATGNRDSPFYFLAIQFFLHFQFNGWFITALLAILIKMLENMGHKFPNVTVFKRWGWVYVLSVCLGFAMPFYWGFPYFFTLVLFGISALTQFVFFLFIFRGFNAPIGLFIKNVSQSVKLLFYTVLSSLLLKLVLQIFATIPTLASAARWNVHFTVGFIHLILLGVVSSLLLFFVLMNQYISKKLKWCIAIFVWTFAATETLLFTNGIMILMNVHLSWNFNLFMFLASIGFPMTIFGISIFMNYRETSLNSQFKG